MAILTFAAPVSGLRGKVGGLVYSANQSGPYLKTFGKGSNPRSFIQTEQRGILVEFAQSWKSLTAGEQSGWDTYAAAAAQEKFNSLGESYFVSGFNWFVAININRKINGQAQLDTAPVAAVPGQPTLQFARFSVTGAVLDSRVLLTAGSSGLTDPLAVYARVFNSDGRQTASQVRIHLLTEVPSGSRDVVLTDEIDDKFGTIQLGQKCFFEVATQSTEGRQGARDAIAVDATS